MKSYEQGWHVEILNFFKYKTNICIKTFCQKNLIAYYMGF